ncbi:MAG: hypothetical protein Phog2KO_47980 [Phototrophicaceae bacterium]
MKTDLSNLRNTQIGIFRLEELIGEGGMGVIYKAEIVADQKYPARNGAKVALKIASIIKYAEEFRMILEDEVRILRKIRHPGVVRVYPIGIFKPDQYLARASEIEGAPWYFAMELLPSKTLKRTDLSGFSMPWRTELIYQLALALGYVHGTRNSHQDFKPDNIMFRSEVSKDKPVPQPVLIDFGLGQQRREGEKIIEDRRDRAMSVLYSSPERIEHMRAERGTAFNYDATKDDVWAFGAVAYEILNGRYMFEKYVSKDMTNRQMGEVIQTRQPIEMKSEVPKVLQELVLAMLHQNAERRPRMAQIIQYLETDIEFLPPRI